MLSKKRKRLDEVSLSHQEYAQIVADVENELSSEVYTETGIKLEIVSKRKWLISYDKLVNFVETKCITGPMDSFLVAACLLYALIEEKRFRFELTDGIPEKVLLSNYELALRVALKVASKPTTYLKEVDKWKKRTFEEKKLYIPEGIISDSPLYKRILQGLAQSDIYSEGSSILQMSNLLHLIYLTC